MKRRIVFLVLGAMGCDRHDVDTAVSAPSASAAPATLLDVEAASRCEVSYGCGMSHPGLGTSMQSTTIDLGACTKTTATTSGPFNGPLDASSATIAIQPAHCASLKGLVSAITTEDAKHEQEPAHVDTPACTLTVTCKPSASPVIRVQRQTLTGSGNVTKLIQGIQRAH